MNINKIRQPVVYILIIVSLSLVFLTIGLFYNLNAPIPFEEDKIIFIPKGSSLSKVGDLLSQGGIIGHKTVFVWSTRLRGMGEEIQAGEFLIPARSSLNEIFSVLAFGKTVQHSITFPEGLTSQKIVNLLNDEKLLVEKIETKIEEGTLLPDTYYFSRGDSKAEILNRMQDNRDVLLNDLWENRDKSIILKSPQEALILASIVERETGLSEERPLIANVFLNRLKKNMRLQSDPTVIYDITGGEDLKRAILQSDLDKDTPYNTYKIRGLPPGPISNPGRASLEAVFNPLATKYLYFVAKGTGGHVFSETLEEHNKNVSKWRKIEKNQK